jgi:hypothetical protein
LKVQNFKLVAIIPNWMDFVKECTNY